MAKAYGDRADFWVIYVREAHPADGWQMPQNQRDGVVFNAPKSFAERERIASECETGLRLKMPILIDNMDDAVEHAYSGWPDRIYIVGKDGRIAFKGDRGPGGFRPAAAEQTLKRILG